MLTDRQPPGPADAEALIFDALAAEMGRSDAAGWKAWAERLVATPADREEEER